MAKQPILVLICDNEKCMRAPQRKTANGFPGVHLDKGVYLTSQGSRTSLDEIYACSVECLKKAIIQRMPVQIRGSA